MVDRHVPPTLHETPFTCPHCGVLAQQVWAQAGPHVGGGVSHWYAQCHSCYGYSYWEADQLVWPSARTAPRPDPGLQDDLLADYQEAADIVDRSPRGAAALLRLIIQKIVNLVGDSNADINTNIGELVKKGLPVRLQQALDVVRVIGNEAVHPGTIDLNDNRETALALFSLVNMIVDDLITQPAEIERLYKTLPQSKLDGIAERDRRSGL